MTRALIVNADDFGRTRGVSGGIIEAHLHGLVTTTTALVNLPGAVQDVVQATLQAPTLGLGVHLNLTLGRPVLSPAAIPSLVTPEGFFHSPDSLIASVSHLDPADVASEWRAQIEVFLATGARLDHLDSHHHAALLSPTFWRICLNLAAEFGCGVRPPAPHQTRDNVLFSRFPDSARRYAAGDARRLLREIAVPCPDQLITRFYAHGATLPALLSILDSVPQGTTELMCHPGWADANLQRVSGYAQERERELRALTSRRAFQTATSLGIVRPTYRTAIPWPR
jgi:chitin disaccharide deacetylase